MVFARLAEENVSKNRDNIWEIINQNNGNTEKGLTEKAVEIVKQEQHDAHVDDEHNDQFWRQWHGELFLHFIDTLREVRQIRWNAHRHARFSAHNTNALK